MLTIQSKTEKGNKTYKRDFHTNTYVGGLTDRLCARLQTGSGGFDSLTRLFFSGDLQ